MTTKERTLLFNLVVVVFNLVVGLAIEGAIIILLIVAMANLPESVAQSVPVSVILPFLMFLGLIAAILVSIAAIQWAIPHFHLEDKLDPALVKKYTKK